jgi:PAS domain S-box-containing protein
MAVSDMIKGSLVAAVISDPRLPDNPIIACNSAFETLTGYTHDEVIGRNCRFLTGPDSEPELIEALREGIREHRPVMVEILNYKKNGAPFRNAVMVAPLFDGEGKLEYFLGSQMEINEDTGGTQASVAREKVERLTPRQRAASGYGARTPEQADRLRTGPVGAHDQNAPRRHVPGPGRSHRCRCATAGDRGRTLRPSCPKSQACSRVARG